MTLQEIVNNLTHEVIADTENYVVDIAVSDSKINTKVSIFLDSDKGITIEECSVVSRILGEKLEEIIENAFTLEVSSPGLDKPIKIERQYLKNIGRSLNIMLKDKSKISGKLLEVRKDRALILELSKKKKSETETVTINLDDIHEAKVIVSFK